MANYDFSGLMDEKTPDVKGSVVPKSLYKLWGAEITPEMEKSSPYLSAIGKTAQEGIATPALHYLNMAAGGIPEIIARQTGHTIPSAETLPGKILSGGADIAGFATGAPMRAGKAAMGIIPKAVKGATLAKKAITGAAKGALQLGTAGALHSPGGEIGTLRERGLRAILGGVGGAAIGTVGGLVEHFTGLLSNKALLKTGEATRSGYKGFKKKLTNWFGGKLDKFQRANPDQRVDMSNEIKAFDVGLGDKAKYKALLNSSPRFRKIIAKGGKNVTLKEAQDLVNQLESGVSESQLSGFKVRPSTGEVTTFINSLRDSMVKAFPGLKHTRKVYGLMNSYTTAVENYMKFGKTTQGIKTMVKNPELRKSLESILPKETFDTLVQTAGAQTISKEGMRALDYLVRYGILYSFMRNMMDRGQGDSGGGFEEN